MESVAVVAPVTNGATVNGTKEMATSLSAVQ